MVKTMRSVDAGVRFIESAVIAARVADSDFTPRESPGTNYLRPDIADDLCFHRLFLEQLWNSGCLFTAKHHQKW
jgi:hypothetical protein